MVLPIEWDREAVPRMSTFDHGWYWIPRSGCQQGTVMGEAATMADMINFRGERMTKALEGTEKHNRLRAQSGWRNQRVHRLISPPTPTWRLSGIFCARGSSGFPDYVGWPLINLNFL